VRLIGGMAVFKAGEDEKSRQIVRRRIVLLPYTPGWGPCAKVGAMMRWCDDERMREGEEVLPPYRVRGRRDAVIKTRSQDRSSGDV